MSQGTTKSERREEQKKKQKRHITSGATMASQIKRTVANKQYRNKKIV